MTTDLILVLSALATVATALVAGVFLAFSDFVMRSLVAARPVAGIETMQIINRTVYRSVFMVLLLGMVPVSLVLAALSIMAEVGAAPTWHLAGGTIYLVGVVAITRIGNVPMNQRLDAMPTDAAGTRVYWATYGRVWTRRNHMRAAASALSAVCYLLGSLALAGM